ncbi:hypothetical protein [Streptomyces colonosanans]|uniref:Helix-turn-helix domain-containing protein n=1 Tax=Streptomyces colonosanans TaxID=1428652 RepID=A0A1S2P885_9ACTN|nr:hypothetical protein [Streptomyces colonosanans]OIJ89762.1 hypothetical protein BIV24_19270 [Streptomyces colonosanans]
MTSHSSHSVTAVTVTRAAPVNLSITHEALTVPEAMAALRLSRFKVYDLIRSKQLQSLRAERGQLGPWPTQEEES